MMLRDTSKCTGILLRRELRSCVGSLLTWSHTSWLFCPPADSFFLIPTLSDASCFFPFVSCSCSVNFHFVHAHTKCPLFTHPPFLPCSLCLKSCILTPLPFLSLMCHVKTIIFPNWLTKKWKRAEGGLATLLLHNLLTNSVKFSEIVNQVRRWTSLGQYLCLPFCRFWFRGANILWEAFGWTFGFSFPVGH